MSRSSAIPMPSGLDHPEPTATQLASPPARPRAAAVLIAPLVGVFQPRRAAATFAAAPAAWFWATLLLYLTLTSRIFQVALVWLASLNPGDRFRTGGIDTVERFIIQTVGGMALDDRIPFLASLLGSVSLPLLALLAGFSLVSMSRTFGNDGLIASYERAFRGAASTVAVFAVLHLGALLITFAWSRMPGIRYDSDWYYVRVIGLGEMFASYAAILWFFWMDYAVGGARAPDAARALVCESCGYLIHAHDALRCSECGALLAESVDGRRRCGAPWESHPSPRSWLRSGFGCQLRPRDFYGRLRLSGGFDAARAFAWWHYLALGFAAHQCCRYLSLLEDGLGISALGGWHYFLPVLLPIACWISHRLIGVAVGCYWTARRMLPDARWIAKLVDYEASFCWTALLFNGAVVTAAMLAVFALTSPVTGRLTAPGWVNQWIQGVCSGSLSTFMLINLVVLAAALWRYQRAHLAIRWSNF